MVKEFSSINESMGKVIKTRNARIWLDETGIVVVAYMPGAEETLEDAEENHMAIMKLIANKKRPVYINPGHHRSMDRAARIYYAKNTPQAATAIAVFISSPFTQVLLTFLKVLNQTINKDELPMKFFTSEEDALDWLRGYLE